jgi:putative flippase GtrA
MTVALTADFRMIPPPPIRVAVLGQWGESMVSLRALFNGTKVRFLLVGGWNTVFGYAVFWVLYGFFARVIEVRYVAYTTTQIVSWLIAVTNAYLLHKYVTFRSRARGRAALLEFFRFMQVYFAMFLLGLALLPFFVEIAGLTPRVAALVVTVIGIVISYAAHTLRTFRHDDVTKAT